MTTKAKKKKSLKLKRKSQNSKCNMLKIEEGGRKRKKKNFEIVKRSNNFPINMKTVTLMLPFFLYAVFPFCIEQRFFFS